MTLVCLKVIFTMGCKWKITAEKKIIVLEVAHRVFSYVLCEAVLNWNLCSLRIKGLKSKDWSFCNLNPEIPSTKVQNGLSQSDSFLVQYKNNFPLESFYSINIPMMLSSLKQVVVAWLLHAFVVPIATEYVDMVLNYNLWIFKPWYMRNVKICFLKGKMIISYIHFLCSWYFIPQIFHGIWDCILAFLLRFRRKCLFPSKWH